MTPAEYQQALARICMAPAPPHNDLDALGGDRSRWLLYRAMVRKRIVRTLRESMPRTAALAGEPLFTTLVEEFMARHAPRSRYIRDLVPEFDDHLHTDDATGDRGPSALLDLARYERNVWQVWDLDIDVPRDAIDFDFDRPAALNPCHRIITCTHPVWNRERLGDGGSTCDPTRVVIVRGPDDRVASVVLEPWTWAVLEAWLAGDGQATTAETVRQLDAAGLIELSPEFVDRLCDTLATWIDRGLLLGSR